MSEELEPIGCPKCGLPLAERNNIFVCDRNHFWRLEPGSDILQRIVKFLST